MAEKKTKMPREYRRALGGAEPEATVLRIPVRSREPSSVAEIEERLRRAGIGMRFGEVPAPGERQIPRAAVEAAITLGDGLTVRIAARESSGELPESELDWSRLTKPEIDAAKSSTWSVVVRGSLRRESVLADYHRLVKIASAVAPDAIAVMDQNAFRTHPARWLHDAAASRVPPSPTALYTIHSVYDDPPHPSGRGGGPGAKAPGVWLHTHGLLRCGTIELEMAELPLEGAASMGTLLNAVAPMFIERRAPAPRTGFVAGRGIELVWIPWEEAVPLLDEGALGGPADRNADHSRPSGVLFARGDAADHMRNPGVFIETMENNPVLYVSDMETERMSLLSRERLPSFLSLLSKHANSKGWRFLVKLGYPVDGAESPTDREHLWFDVHGASGPGSGESAPHGGSKESSVDATLLNEPYHIARMHEGERGWHPLSRLSGWSILAPAGRFGPDSVLDLERTFDKPDPTELN